MKFSHKLTDLMLAEYVALKRNQASEARDARRIGNLLNVRRYTGRTVVHSITRRILNSRIHTDPASIY